MVWHKPQLDPEHTCKLPPEWLERICLAHQAEIDREQDRISEVIRQRLNGPANRSSHAPG